MPLFLLDGLLHCNWPGLTLAEVGTAGLAGSILHWSPSNKSQRLGVLQAGIWALPSLQSSFISIPLISVFAVKRIALTQVRDDIHNCIYKNYKLLITARFKPERQFCHLSFYRFSELLSSKSWSLQSKAVLLPGRGFSSGHNRWGAELERDRLGGVYLSW